MTLNIGDIIREHVASAEEAHTHPLKLVYLTRFLKNLFDVSIQELAPGVEKRLGSRLLGVKGKADLIFSDVVFEIKTDLEGEVEDAKDQLKKYLQALHELSPDRKHIGIATDAVKFIAFVPVFEDEVVVGVKQINSLDMKIRPPTETVAWLDSFIFSKKEIEPTAIDLKIKFGRGSPIHTFGIALLQSLWKHVEHDPNVKLKFDLWTKNMQIVYGLSPEVNKFLEHTYLVNLVKIAIYLRLSGIGSKSKEEILRALTGEYFESYGISNLIEEDFFSWILKENIVDAALEMSLDHVKSLQRYDLSKAEEDLFKEIYEEMVELGQRHRLGEYYTPEWLSKKAILLALQHRKENSKDFPRMLDPACGSGTFLTNAIHLLKTEFKPRDVTDDQLLNEILNKVVGVDVNPLAAVIARANYIIALGDLLRLGKPITIPVFIADSIRLPEAVITVTEGEKVYDIEVDGFHLRIPESVILDTEKRSNVVLGLKEAIKDYKLRHNSQEALQILYRHISEIAEENERSVLKRTLSTLEKLVDRDLDSIWTFILSNIYATLSLRGEKFQLLASNPPWIVMRSIENRTYQDFLKRQVFNYNLLEKSKINLFTHMEMATLFFCRTSDLYLSDKGIIAFLMPISVLTGAYHHVAFQYFQRPQMRLLSVHNFRGVKSIFSLPLYVLVAQKGKKTEYPVKAFDYIGKIDESQKNERLENIKDQINWTEYLYRPPIIPEHPSVYHKKFKEGATFVPRNLWFVDFEFMPSLGAFNVSRPKVKTAHEVVRVAKPKWKDHTISGNVESDYLFATLLGKDLFPFGFVKFRPLVLPIEPLGKGGGYRVLDLEQLRLRGAAKMANWLEKAQEIWEKERTQKSETNFPRVIDRLDYHGLLRRQNQKRYTVLFNARGADSLAYVIDRTDLPHWKVQNVAVNPVNLVVDYTAYYFETDSSQEAHYLCALLNSNIVHQRVKGFQPSGLYGKRDIGRRPLRLAIPEFNRKNRDHLALVELSKACHSAVRELCNTGKGFRKTRNQASTLLESELKQIDKIADRIIKS